MAITPTLKGIAYTSAPTIYKYIIELVDLYDYVPFDYIEQYIIATETKNNPIYLIRSLKGDSTKVNGNKRRLQKAISSIAYRGMVLYDQGVVAVNIIKLRKNPVRPLVHGEPIEASGFISKQLADELGIPYHKPVPSRWTKL